jgi:nucleotide-binding universal stress UspA family protein
MKGISAMKKEVFVPLVTYPDPTSEPATSNVLAVAKHLEADLYAMALTVDVPDVSSALGRILLNVPEMIREAEANSRTNAGKLLGLVKQLASQEGVNVVTDETSAAPAEFGNVAAAHARYYDLTVVPCDAQNETARMTAEALVFGSGRPVIMVPGTPLLRSLDHVMVAWDGSTVAARASSDAQPLLHRASHVSIVTVVDEKPINNKDIGKQLAEKLKRRGLTAEALSITAEDCPIGETLQAYALDMGAGLLVMGGYGHSRLRHFVLGGATEDVLSELRLPILMSH